jgi:chorismate synthase
MPRLRLLTAGESHGPGLVAILEGLPHGLPVEKSAIDEDLHRRQLGYGRGGRMKIERDVVEVLSGMRAGRTLGSPLAMLVRNLDHAAWTDVMDPFAAATGERSKALTRPRPGHADLSGALKLGLHDARDVLERSSARSTTARVAAGAVCKALLRACGADLMCHVTRIGAVEAPPLSGDLLAARAQAEASEVRCVDDAAGEAMKQAIREAQQAGDSLGGVVEVICWGLVPGLGSHVEWDLRLDGRLAQALMSIQAMKGVEVGLGFPSAARPGSKVHDPIVWREGAFAHLSNNAGGVEGGNTNGEPVIVRAAMKPIPTLARPLPSVDLETKQPFDAQKERTDSCAVPAAAVVAEAAIAFVLADALLDKTGGDSLDEVQRNLQAYRDALAKY